MPIEKVRAKISQFSCTYVINMQVLAVVKMPSIYNIVTFRSDARRVIYYGGGAAPYL